MEHTTHRKGHKLVILFCCHFMDCGNIVLQQLIFLLLYKPCQENCGNYIWIQIGPRLRIYSCNVLEIFFFLGDVICAGGRWLGTISVISIWRGQKEGYSRIVCFYQASGFKYSNKIAQEINDLSFFLSVFCTLHSFCFKSLQPFFF